MQPNGPGPLDHDQPEGAHAAEVDAAAIERGLTELQARISELDAIAWNLPSRRPEYFPPDAAWPEAD